MSDEPLERPPIAPIAAYVVAGLVAVFFLKWALRAIVGGIKFAVLMVVVVAVIYAVSRFRSADDD